jgi:hypothetical protein
MATLGKSTRQRSRYGVGEWYGKLFCTLNAEERIAMASISLAPARKNQALPCPSRSRGAQQVPCSKAGGVCTLRLYEWHAEANIARPAEQPAGGLRTTCPYRFEQNSTIYKWIGETLLSTCDPVVVREVGFLEREHVGDAGLRDDVGRIDNVLIHPDTRTLNWCAMELQAVYFSGPSMSWEFRNILEHGTGTFPFPLRIRRPDYRSSGPKRLMPQLQIKVPTLRRWGKKMAVVVDRAFFDALGKMDDLKDVSNADIAWFVVDYSLGESAADLVPGFIRFTTLERAVEGLTAGHSVALAEFEERLRAKLSQRPATTDSDQ